MFRRTVRAAAWLALLLTVGVPAGAGAWGHVGVAGTAVASGLPRAAEVGGLSEGIVRGDVSGETGVAGTARAPRVTEVRALPRGAGEEPVSRRRAPARPLAIAHRGAARTAPENTLAAADAAHRQGVAWVENDVQRTKDGKLVVMHDTTLQRTTNAEQVFPGRSPWRVGDFTAAELARLDAGSWFGKQFAGERVPTLRSFLERMEQNGQRLLLEIKAPGRYPGIEALILQELRHMGWLDAEHVRDRLVVQSFDAESVRMVHRLVPAVRTGFIGAPPPRALASYARFADQVNPRLAQVDRRYVAAVHRLRGPHGLPLAVNVWDAAGSRALRTATAYGVDGIID
ncbi:glycerophosphodiester phosphodiesterase family protein [Streptomyces sp. NPDC003077]|uniref:glycerophosphodiester phosphodiesterase n=1 Tax=Streptomyces sp. NPDC003077 TaxID=3154443 RepID=UPI0033B57720